MAAVTKALSQKTGSMVLAAASFGAISANVVGQEVPVINKIGADVGVRTNGQQANTSDHATTNNNFRTTLDTFTTAQRLSFSYVDIVWNAPDPQFIPSGGMGIQFGLVRQSNGQSPENIFLSGSGLDGNVDLNLASNLPGSATLWSLTPTLLNPSPVSADSQGDDNYKLRFNFPATLTLDPDNYGLLAYHQSPGLVTFAQIASTTDDQYNIAYFKSSSGTSGLVGREPAISFVGTVVLPEPGVTALGSALFSGALLRRRRRE